MSSIELKNILEKDTDKDELLVNLIYHLSKKSSSIKVKNAAKKKHVDLLGKSSEFFPKLNGQFYTKRFIAQMCIDELDLKGDEMLIEPSAGRGDFIEVFPENSEFLAFDIDPKHTDVTEKDFFTFSPSTDKRIVAIGNPPFGVNANLAVSFFRHAATFADTIAFILPRTFKKTSIQNKLPMNFHLKKEVPLPSNSFYVENGSTVQNFNLRGVFQVWQKSDTLRAEVKEQRTHHDFSFVKKEGEHDFAVRRAGNRAGEVFEKTENVAVEGNYFIKQNLGENDKKVIETFKTAWLEELDPKIDKDKSGFKYDSAGQSTISKPEMIKIYKKYLTQTTKSDII